MLARFRSAAALATVTSVAAAATLLTLFGGVAQAQSVSLGGSVDDQMILGLSPVSGFATFPRQAGDNVYTLSFDATVTTTTDNTPVTLSLDTTGTSTTAQLGHLVNAQGRPLPLPLEVAGSTGDLMSLDQPIGPVLQSWPQVVSSAPVSVELSQEINGTSGVTSGPYSAQVYVTLSSDAP